MKNVDVLFVHPNGAPFVYQGLSTTYSAIEPPIWAALLANHVRVKGHTTAIIDCEAERFDVDASAQAILDYETKLVAVVVYGQQPSASTQNMHAASLLCKKLKEEKIEAKVLLLGLHPSAVARQTINREAADFVCQGEGMYTITSLLSGDMNKLSDLEKVPGLWYRDNGHVKFTKPAEIVDQKDLEAELPGMAWDLLPMEKYRTSNWHAMSNGGDRMPFASLYTSLGCPFQCSFCCINAPFGNNNVENWDYGRNKFRFWDPSFIIKEFEEIHQRGIRNVKIADEMFVLNKSHFLKLCQLITERKYDFNIWAYARIDTVREEYLAPLKDAGVEWLALGIESGNAVVRKDVVKGKFTSVNITDLVQKIKDAGINVIGNYIFGLPEDNHETMQETLNLAMDLNCEFSNFYSTMAYPGSKLYLDALLHRWELPDSYVGFSQHSYETTPLRTNFLSPAEVLAFRDKAFDTYHQNDKYLQFIKSKFGDKVHDDLVAMSKHKLKRKLLGD
jgi:anaerobic magnesium-protoporphyrin IX monomethyl ester cyclase